MKINKIQNTPTHTMFFLDTNEVIAVEKNSPQKEKRIQDSLICDYFRNSQELTWEEIDKTVASIRQTKIHIL